MSTIIWVLVIRLLLAGVEAGVEEFKTELDCQNAARQYRNAVRYGHIVAYCKPTVKIQDGNF